MIVTAIGRKPTPRTALTHPIILWSARAREVRATTPGGRTRSGRDVRNVRTVFTQALKHKSSLHLGSQLCFIRIGLEPGCDEHEPSNSEAGIQTNEFIGIPGTRQFILPHGIKAKASAWYGMLCYGMVWWYGTVGMVWYGMVRYGMVWCGGMVWYVMVCYGMLWYGGMV